MSAIQNVSGVSTESWWTSTQQPDNAAIFSHTLKSAKFNRRADVLQAHFVHLKVVLSRLSHALYVNTLAHCLNMPYFHLKHKAHYFVCLDV